MMSQEGQPYSKSREEMVQISERPPKEVGFQKKGNARDPLTLEFSLQKGFFKL